MVAIPGQNVAAPIRPYDTNDTHFTFLDTEGKGGLRIVNDLTERDSTPLPRQKVGMEVKVLSNGLKYELNSTATVLTSANWTLIDVSGGSGFIPYAGEGITITPTSSNYIFSVIDYISKTETALISSGLQTQINDINVIGGTGIGVTESPNNTFIVSVSGDYATLSQVNSATGNAYIQAVALIPTTLDSLSDVIITTPIADQVLKYNGVNWVNGAPVSGGGGVTESYVQSYANSTSANAYNQSIAYTNTVVTNTTGNLQSQIDSINVIGGDGIGVTESPNNTFIVSVSGDYATLSQVNSASANAYIQSQSYTNTVVANTTGYLQTQINSISGNLNSQYGIISCNTTDKEYHITHAYIDVNTTAPQISLTIPSNSSALYVQGVTNRDSYGFDVILSSVPMVSGYEINWVLNNNGNGTLIIDNTIVVNTSTTNNISGSIALNGQYTSYDITINGAINILEPTDMLSGQPIILKITQNGINTATWDSSFIFQEGTAPIITQVNGATDIYTIVKFGDYYYVSGVQNFI